MSEKEKKIENPVARLRERFYEIKRSIKISPELKEALRDKSKDKKDEQKPSDGEKKIASRKRDPEAGL